VSFLFCLSFRSFSSFHYLFLSLAHLIDSQTPEHAEKRRKNKRRSCVEGGATCRMRWRSFSQQKKKKKKKENDFEIMISF